MADEPTYVPARDHQEGDVVLLPSHAYRIDWLKQSLSGGVHTLDLATEYTEDGIDPAHCRFRLTAEQAGDTPLDWLHTFWAPWCDAHMLERAQKVIRLQAHWGTQEWDALRAQGRTGA